MNKKIIALIIVSVIIVVGFVFALVFSTARPIGCTEMYCPCDGVAKERPCNTCGYGNYYFTLGIVNIYDSCSAKEIVTCDGTNQIGSRIDKENATCKLKIGFFN